MKKILLLTALIGGCVCLQSQTAAPVFIEKPYLQLGDNAKLQKNESLTLLWHTANTAANFTVEVKTSADKNWRVMAKPESQVVQAPAIDPHFVYRAKLTNLVPGEAFAYRVNKDGQQVFAANGKARKSASQPYKLVMFGDCAQGTPAQRAIAYETSKIDPDFLFITGDIVYNTGRIAEYRSRYFPVYAADNAAPETGAPLIQSVPFLAAPGNHDTAAVNFSRFPDALAYFLYWDMPLNGPMVHGDKTEHHLAGNPDAQPAFLSGAGPRYPVMANFSFDYGNAHWTVLDSNPYMDWTNADLQAWIQKDIASASGATWHFVAFHHPGFNSATTHLTDQWMRQLAPLFEKAKVDVVFSGHVHNYQRSFPLTFVPKGAQSPKGEVDGDFQFDKNFGDGATAKPKGVIYIITGGGGAALYNPEMTTTPEKWLPFTNKFVSDKNSFSVVDVDGKTFRFRQVGADGSPIDAFQIAK